MEIAYCRGRVEGNRMDLWGRQTALSVRETRWNQLGRKTGRMLKGVRLRPSHNPHYQMCLFRCCNPLKWMWIIGILDCSMSYFSKAAEGHTGNELADGAFHCKFYSLVRILFFRYWTKLFSWRIGGELQWRSSAPTINGPAETQAAAHFIVE